MEMAAEELRRRRAVGKKRFAGIKVKELQNMKIIEHSQHKLVLRSHKSFWEILLVSITLIPISLFFCLLGLALQSPEHLGFIIIIIIGCGGVMGGLYMIALAEVTTYTFDKVKNCICWERQTLLKGFNTKSVEFPAHLICGVEVEDVSGTEGGIAFYPRLILASVYWRIPLNSDGQYQSAVRIAEMISQFLEIPYFSEKSKAPSQKIDIGMSHLAQNWLFSWQYLEDKIECLRQQLNIHPHDATTYQDLAISLYYLNSWLYRQEALMYLKEAERLFESKNDRDRAAIARIVRSIIW